MYPDENRYDGNRNYNRGRDGRGGGNRNDRGGHHGGHGEGRSRRGTPLSELDPALTEVSRKVIGCAIEVHMELGPGYDESVYLNALKVEMEREGVAYKVAHPFDVYFDEHVVGKTVADLWVADRFIVEVMARPVEIGWWERAALRAQLRAADVELGLIINFGGARLKEGLVRVLNPDKLNELKGEGGEEHHEEVAGAFEEETQA